jgi:hypothetical protein
MDWARILAFVTGMVDQEVLARNEYLAAENRILKARLEGRLKLSDAERATLGEIGHRLGRKILGEVANVARPDTILAWYRKLVARKFDGSKARRGPGRPRSGAGLHSDEARRQVGKPRFHLATRPLLAQHKGPAGIMSACSRLERRRTTRGAGTTRGAWTCWTCRSHRCHRCPRTYRRHWCPRFAGTCRSDRRNGCQRGVRLQRIHLLRSGRRQSDC